MKKRIPKVVIVMPAYNAEMTLEDTFREIPPKYKKHVILVDDFSSDDTSGVASKLNIVLIKHKKNMGYGANQKTCYNAALKLNPDVVAMLHADYQYSAKYLRDLIELIEIGKYDFMFGSRISTRRSALDGGMPKLKYYTNRFFTVVQNIILGVNFTEHFSGFRAYSADVLKTVPYQKFSNDFLFDLHMTLSALSYGFRIGEIPIPTRYDEESSSMSLQKGIKFIFETTLLLISYILHQKHLVKSKLFSRS
ncbi:MAG: glycosyl transferase family 2 [Candidatus Pacebacteria bacterium CG_4_10_14_0_8_um_filter_42_14]|nr:MAG: glycosyl transferase family 2 [Candidatus Pacebacteria bacterium CG_4_10_14_0_8_um_filter_42_14]